jgi:hypothetical protein
MTIYQYRRQWFEVSGQGQIGNLSILDFVAVFFAWPENTLEVCQRPGQSQTPVYKLVRKQANCDWV